MPPESEAPGLQVRRRKNGATAYYWIASTLTQRAAQYRTKIIRLREATHEERAERCRVLTAELRLWLGGGSLAASPFDGTIESLAAHYQRTPESPYAAVQENTRTDYDQRIRLIIAAVGRRRIDLLTRVDFVRWHTLFKAPAKEGGPERIRQAHGLMTMVRMLLAFGVSMRFPGCEATVAVLREIVFEAPKAREEAITFGQAEAIVDSALAARRRSIALGQALQFELAVRQVDVIGKWFKGADNEGGIVFRGNRWGGGLLWSHVSPDLTISKRTTKTAAKGEWDLRECPLVMKALAAYPADDRVGPMIVSELTGIPYDRFDYAHDWRPFAEAAGVPRSVWNRDSRAGGITEAWDADASEKDIQRLATHEDPAMTRRYARNAMASTTRVQKLRVASRKKDGGQ